MQETMQGHVDEAGQSGEVDEVQEQAHHPAASIGSELAAARIAQGLEVADVARSLKLSHKQVEALEAEDFASMSGNTFVRGFIRNYAKLLQLDPRPLLERFQQGAPTEAHALSATSQQIVLPGGAGKRRLIYLGLAAVLVLAAPVLVYEMLHGEQERPQPLGAVVAPPAAPRPAVVEPVVPPEAAARPPEEFAQAQPLSPSPAAPATVSEVPRPVPGAVVPQALPPAASALAAGKPAPEAAAAKPSAIKLVFAGQSWVEIKDGRGKIILSEMNPGGSERQIDGVPPFSLVVGNATQVRIAYNGEPVDLAPHMRGDVARLTLK